MRKKDVRREKIDANERERERKKRNCHKMFEHRKPEKITI